jgi:hypothetical protein
MGGTLKTQSVVISSIKLSIKYQIDQQKVPSVFFYVEIRWTKLNEIVILSYFPYVYPKAKLRLEVLFRKKSS